MQCHPQACCDWQTGVVFARFNTPKITGTHADIFGQFFLSQITSRTKARHVSSETLAKRTIIGLARGHRVNVRKAKKLKQEALHPLIFCFHWSKSKSKK
jgi:hypothetical protein